MNTADLTMKLRSLLADLIGRYHDPDPAGAPGSPYHDIPAISHGQIPDSVTATGLEAHVDNITILRPVPLYRYETVMRHHATVYLVAHDGTPPDALQLARERVVAAFQADEVQEIPEVPRAGIQRQFKIFIAVKP